MNNHSLQAQQSSPRGNRWQFSLKLWLFVVFWVCYALVIVQRLTEGDAVVWTPYSAAELQKARAAGKPVLISFVADWDPVCLWNKGNLFNRPNVEHVLHARRYVTLEADFSQGDTEIKRLMMQYDQHSIPLILIYPADPARPAIVLPDHVREHTLIEALRRATTPPMMRR